MDSPLPLKRCYACTQSFPAMPEYFSRNKRNKDGLHDACKACDRAKRRAYAATHKEQESQSRKLFREKNEDRLREEQKQFRASHKEQIAAGKRQQQQGEVYKTYQKRYYEEHKEAIHVQQRDLYIANREHAIEKQRRYNKTLQGKMVSKAQRQRRKAQKRKAGGSYTSQELREQFQRQKARCYYCKAKLAKVWHADHVIPLSKGGTNDIGNIVIACQTCNLRKSAKLLHEWPEGGRLL